MATVRDLITDALAANGALGQGESLSDDDVQLCLRRLQRMIDSWANDVLTVFDTTEGTMTLVAGTTSYSTTSLSSGRPVSVQNMFLRLDNVDYPVTMIDEESYDAQCYKPATGLPIYCQYAPSYPNGTFYFYPTPSDAYVAHVKGRYPLGSSWTVNTAVSLPPGYEAALCDNLAVDVASAFGRPVSAALAESARKAKVALQMANRPPMLMQTALPGSGEGYVPGYLRIQGDT